MKYSRMNIITLVIIALLSAVIPNVTAQEIGNDSVSLTMKNGKAIIAYHLNGAIKSAVELEVIGVTMQNAIKAKSGSDASLKIKCDKQVVLNIALCGNSPYMMLNITAPTNQKNTVLLKFKSDVMVVPDTLSDNYILFRDELNDNGGYLFPRFHMVVNMLNDGAAMFSCAWLNAGRVLSGRTTQKVNAPYDYCKIEFKGNNRLMLGLPAAKNIWGKVNKKLPVKKFQKFPWQPPFAAKWLISYSVLDLNIKSKLLFLDESYIIPTRMNNNNKVLVMALGYSIWKQDIWEGYDQADGPFSYPAYLKNGELFLRQVKFRKKVKKAKHDRPHLIYALDAKPNSTGISLMPIPALAKLLSEKELQSMRWTRLHAGYGSCDATQRIEKIFRRAKQVEKQELISKIIKKMQEFHIEVRERLKQYLAWNIRTKRWLKAERLKNSQLTASATVLSENLETIDHLWKKKQTRAKEVKDFIRALNKIKALIGSAKAMEQQEDASKQLGRELRTMGGTQHHLIGAYRQCIRGVRRIAVDRLMAASDPAEVDFLTAFIERTSKILRIKHGEEGK